MQEDDTDSYLEDDESANEANEGVTPIRTAKEAHAAWGQFGRGAGGAGGAGIRGGEGGGGGGSEKTNSNSKKRATPQAMPQATPQAGVSALEMSASLDGWKGNPLVDDKHHSRHEYHSMFGGVAEGVSEARTVNDMVGNLHNSLTMETAL